MARKEKQFVARFFNPHTGSACRMFFWAESMQFALDHARKIAADERNADVQSDAAFLNSVHAVPRHAWIPNDLTGTFITDSY